MKQHNYIIAAKRSAVVPRDTLFADLDIHELGAPVIQALLADNNISPARIDELIVANALGAGGNPARLIGLAAGLAERIGGLSIDRQCCGGLDALLVGSDMLSAGRASLVIAGGAESYSRRPKRLRKLTTSDMGSEQWQAYERPPFTPWPTRDPDMSAAAEEIAQRYDICFEQQNDWAVASHQKALAAHERLRAEIVSIKGVCHDSFARRLKPAVCKRSPRIIGSISAANTAVAADGAAFCLLAGADIAEQYPKPKLRILSGCTVGADPFLPGLAPVPAIRAALRDAGIKAEDLQCAEIMEAYAVQAIACIQQSGIKPEICNLGGGALSRGHPIGASGAILISRLFTELQHNGGGIGLAAIAAAGGLGTALVVEYLE
ncbi:MAG: acetyl-CoA C-acyltransferase [Proteobacteria bacterium]|nr:MAG: acetyl-CoA C-acyltransferase [Pseudomonadota bacterium]